MVCFGPYNTFQCNALKSSSLIVTPDNLDVVVSEFKLPILFAGNCISYSDCTLRSPAALISIQRKAPSSDACIIKLRWRAETSRYAGQSCSETQHCSSAGGLREENKKQT